MPATAHDPDTLAGKTTCPTLPSILDPHRSLKVATAKCSPPSTVAHRSTCPAFIAGPHPANHRDPAVADEGGSVQRGRCAHFRFSACALPRRNSARTSFSTSCSHWIYSSVGSSPSKSSSQRHHWQHRGWHSAGRTLCTQHPSLMAPVRISSTATVTLEPAERCAEGRCPILLKPNGRPHERGRPLQVTRAANARGLYRAVGVANVRNGCPGCPALSRGNSARRA